MMDRWARVRAWLGEPRHVVVLLLLLGFILRVSCILWGIPILPFTGHYHADEGAAFGHATGFPGNYLTNRVFVYGTTLPYLVAIVVLPLKAHLAVAKYELVCWMGLRIVSVILGSASVGITYLVGRRLYDAKTGIVSAALLAVAFSHCMNSSYANFDAPISFLVITSFFLLLRVIDRDRWRDFIYLGLVAGILVGTKVTMIIVLLIPVVVVFTMRLRPHPDAPPRPLLSELARWSICLSLALAIFVVSNFHVVNNFAAFIAHWKEQKYLWYDRSSVPLADVPEIWWRYTTVALGAPTVVLALVGLFRLGPRDLAVKVSIVTFLIAHFVLLRHHYYPRSAVEIAPLACLLAARACMSFVEIRRVRPLAYASALGAVLFSLTMTCRGILTRLDDPRTQAAKFLAREVPAGATIGVTSPYRHPTVASWEWPRIDERRLRMVDFLQMPDYLISTTDDQLIMGNALRSNKLGPNDAWDPAFNRDWYNYEPPLPPVFAFYRKLLSPDSPYQLIKAFDPKYWKPKIEFGDIGIRIYRRVSPR